MNKPLVDAASLERLVDFLNAQPQPVLCNICGQELTDPISIKRGIGPICAASEAALSDLEE